MKTSISTTNLWPLSRSRTTSARLASFFWWLTGLLAVSIILFVFLIAYGHSPVKGL